MALMGKAKLQFTVMAASFKIFSGFTLLVVKSSELEKFRSGLQWFPRNRDLKVMKGGTYNELTIELVLVVLTCFPHGEFHVSWKFGSSSRPDVNMKKIIHGKKFRTPYLLIETQFLTKM
jgi:hypothetical protein